MEKLYYNLSEEEFTRGRKILIWIFFGAFFFGGVYVLLAGPLFGVYSVKPVLSLAPFGISLIVGLVAAYATIKRKDLFFLMDNEKIEFRYGVLLPKKYSFRVDDMKEFVMPHRERKIKILFKDGTSFIVNLTWIQRKKAILIRKHFYQIAKERNITVIKVIHLPPR